MAQHITTLTDEKNYTANQATGR